MVCKIGFTNLNAKIALLRASMNVTYYIKLFLTGAGRQNGILMSLLLLVAGTINTLISNNMQEKLNCIGYIYDGCIPRKQWLKVADDTATVTTLECDNQHLVKVIHKMVIMGRFNY